MTLEFTLIYGDKVIVENCISWKLDRNGENVILKCEGGSERSVLLRPVVRVQRISDEK